MNSLPSFESYGEYTDKHNGRALVFSVGGIDVYFSYRTPVAFRDHSRLVVRCNDWGPTTGKHLNWIDGGTKEAKARRETGTVFEALLAEAVGK